MSTVNELIGARNVDDPEVGATEEEVEKITKEVGADSIIYQTIPNLVKSIGLPQKDLCMACLNGNYPTSCGSEMCEKAVQNAGKNSCGRTYE